MSKKVSNNTSPIKRPTTYEVINIETYKSNKDLSYQKQKFISQLSKQCNIMFQFMSNPLLESRNKQLQNENQIKNPEKQKQSKNINVSPFYQKIWKNRVLEKAAEQFPQLNQNQLQKLIDRDWRIMRPQTKLSIQNQIQQMQVSNLQNSIAEFQNRLNNYS